MPVIDFFALQTMSEAVKAAKVTQIVNEFPGLFERSQVLWVKFLVGVQKGIYTPTEKRDLYKWFLGVVDIWEKISPNWGIVTGGTYSPRKLAFADSANRWVADVRGQSRPYGLGRLGELTTLAVAGIVLASLTALGLIGWIASSFATMSEESTKRDLHEKRAAGVISDADYQNGMAQYENRTGNTLSSFFGFGDIKGIGKLALGGAALFILWPVLSPLVQKLAGKLGGGRG